MLSFYAMTSLVQAMLQFMYKSELCPEATVFNDVHQKSVPWK